MGQHDLDPRRIDLVGRDQGEHRPDLGVRLATDVLPGPGAQGVVERRLRCVDEEVDRFRLLHSEQVLGLLDALVGDVERPPPEGIAALVPVDPDERSGTRLPVESGVRVEDAGRRARLDLAVQRQPPARREPRVRQDVAVGQLEGVAERLAAGRARRADLGQRRPQRAWVFDENLDLVGDRLEIDRLLEGDPFAVCRVGRRRLERRERRGDGHSDCGQQQDRRCQSGGEAPGSGHWAHASPARRSAPSPFWFAPCSPLRDRAQPDP